MKNCEQSKQILWLFKPGQTGSPPLHSNPSPYYIFHSLPSSPPSHSHHPADHQDHCPNGCGWQPRSHHPAGHPDHCPHHCGHPAAGGGHCHYCSHHCVHEVQVCVCVCVCLHVCVRACVCDVELLQPQ